MNNLFPRSIVDSAKALVSANETIDSFSELLDERPVWISGSEIDTLVSEIDNLRSNRLAAAHTLHSALDDFLRSPVSNKVSLFTLTCTSS